MPRPIPAMMAIKTMGVASPATGTVEPRTARLMVDMQFQADLLGCDLRRPQNTETTSLGAAYLAGLATGFWSNTDELLALRESDDVFSRRMDATRVDVLLAGWHDAVRRTI